MQNIKQRLENLENSTVTGAGTHEEFVLWSLEHGPDDDDLIVVTDEDTDAFLRGTLNLEGSHRAKP